MSRFGSSMGGLIKSIQQGIIVVASGQASGTATISGVNTAKSACWINGWMSPQDIGGASATIVLTNTTTVTVTVYSNGSFVKNVGYLVIEFY